MTKKKKKKTEGVKFFFTLSLFFPFLARNRFGVVELWSTVYMTPRFPYIFLEIVWEKRKAKSSHKIQKALSIDFWLYCYLFLFFFLFGFLCLQNNVFRSYIRIYYLPNVLIDLVLTHAHIHTYTHNILPWSQQEDWDTFKQFSLYSGMGINFNHVPTE